MTILQSVVRRDVIHVFYHLVAHRPRAHVRHLYPYRPVDLFEQDLCHLRSNYDLIGYEQFLELIHSDGITRGKIKALISFDDGFQECYSLVRPLLLEKHLPCIFFIPTYFIDNQSMYYRNKVSLCIETYLNLENTHQKQVWADLVEKYSIDSKFYNFITWIKSITDEDLINQVCIYLNLDWSTYLREQVPYLSTAEILTLAQDGFTIGAHSRRHQKLVRLAPNEIEVEISESCRQIGNLVGCEQVPFSFPNSGDGLDRELLKQICYRHPNVGLLFDTKGLRANTDLIYNRVWIESPKYSPQGITPISEIIRRAYQAQALRI